MLPSFFRAIGTKPLLGAVGRNSRMLLFLEVWGLKMKSTHLRMKTQVFQGGVEKNFMELELEGLE